MLIFHSGGDGNGVVMIKGEKRLREREREREREFGVPLVVFANLELSLLFI